LLFRAVSKADNIDCDSIFLQFFSQNFQGLYIFIDGRSDETYHALFLGFIWTMFQSQSSDLNRLNIFLCTWEKWTTPEDLIPKRNEFALMESDVRVHKIYTWDPPMRPTPTEDCWLAYNFEFIKRLAQSTCPSQRVGS